MRSPPLILVVDDNLAGLEILQARLEANGYSVITATDGEAGLTLARDRRPDLILLDIMMPRMNGIEVCRRIKGDAALPFIPIIMVTAKTDSKDIIAGLEAGGDEYLTKPVDHGALMARVASMLRIKTLQDTVRDQSAQLESQLKTAAKIQSLFWPPLPDLGGRSHLWALSKPAGYIGGDLYDLITLPDGSILAYVADVSGKGVPAALIMAALSTQIRTEAPRHEAVEKLLATINDSFYDLAAEEGFFATMVLARYRPGDGRLQIVSAGHPPPLLIVDRVGKEMSIPRGLAIGVQTGSRYEIYAMRLRSGESILFYSDGITEAENESQEHFGLARVIEHIASAPAAPWSRKLLDAINRWRGPAAVNDDVTLLEIWCD